ncbi:MAG: hypothetical protein J6Y42_01035 [Bacilli bacterium]|nr:hypothetical protein [Bacilli bacterium]
MAAIEDSFEIVMNEFARGLNRPTLDDAVDQLMKETEAILEINEVIRDKEYAIKMLCRTNRAWQFIAPELQADPDVMMCYQPRGVLEQEIFVDVGVQDVVGEDIYAEPEFEYLKRPYGYILVPTWAKNVPGFDYERYAEIQQEMSWDAASYLHNYRDDDATRTKFQKASASMTNLVSEYPNKDYDTGYGDLRLVIYDRSVLRKKFGVEDPEFEPETR